MRRPSRGGQRLAWLLLAWVLVSAPASAQSAADRFLAALSELRDASFLDKEAAAERVIATGNRGALPALTALLEDRLYFRQQDQQVVIVKTADESLPAMEVTDPVSLEAAGSSPTADLTKIGTNNRLRRFLRIALARFALSSPDPRVRLSAVNEMIRALDEATLMLLRQRAAAETDAAVRYAIETGLALAALDHTDRSERLAAISTLRDRLRPEVRNRLTALLATSPDGSFVEGDAEVRRAAAEAVQSINTSRSFYAGIEMLFFGLSLGSVLVLVAIGLAITFGVMGVINMAHGELMMLGAYTTYVMQQLMPGSISV